LATILVTNQQPFDARYKMQWNLVVLTLCCGMQWLPSQAFVIVRSGSRRLSADTPARRSTLLGMVSAERRYEARQLVSDGMEMFRKGEVSKSIDLFDRADALQPDGSLHPFLWQRGLSLYYADRFAEASDQFRSDVKVNPNDVEEIVWDIAAQLRQRPDEFPPSTMMSLPAGNRDRRRIMPTVYRLFRGEGTEHQLAMAGHGNGASVADEFYALFYLGLFCEVRKETVKASEYMRQATRTEYATGIGRGDYMTSCARVHCKLRGWV
jgi:tetratricopeptide (TPR) repeat protein